MFAQSIAVPFLFLTVPLLMTDEMGFWVHASASGFWPAFLNSFDQKDQRDGPRTWQQLDRACTKLKAAKRVSSIANIACIDFLLSTCMMIRAIMHAGKGTEVVEKTAEVSGPVKIQVVARSPCSALRMQWSRLLDA